MLVGEPASRLAGLRHHRLWQGAKCGEQNCLRIVRRRFRFPAETKFLFLIQPRFAEPATILNGPHHRIVNRFRVWQAFPCSPRVGRRQVVCRLSAQAGCLHHGGQQRGTVLAFGILKDWANFLPVAAMLKGCSVKGWGGTINVKENLDSG